MNEDSFARFLDSHRQDLARISRATKGEASPEDVHAEAWLLVAELRSKGIDIDLRKSEHRQLVLARLYQHLVRYTEQNLRYAVRLDHSPGGEAGELHPLAHLLAADELSDPINALMHKHDQERLQERANLGPHGSLASAYLYLLERLGHRMSALADHLLISLSYSYRRCAHARLLAEHQRALPEAAMNSDQAFVPGAWRTFRIKREPVQLSLEFEWDEGLFV